MLKDAPLEVPDPALYDRGLPPRAVSQPHQGLRMMPRLAPAAVHPFLLLVGDDQPAA